MESIIIEAKLTFQDQLRLYYLHPYRLLFILIYILPIPAGVILLLYFINSIDVALSFIAAYLFCVIYIINYNYKLARKKFLSTMEIHGPLRICFTDSQIQFNTLKHESTQKWDEVKKVKEIRKYILFYKDKGFVVLPKRNFSHNELFQFRKMLDAIPGLKTKLRKSGNLKLTAD